MDVTWLIDHWKGIASATLFVLVVVGTLARDRADLLWKRLTSKVTPSATPEGPTLDEAFAAIEVLATYAKATGNHSLSRSAINAFEDVANVPDKLAVTRAAE